jgi:hypothetical protein
MRVLIVGLLGVLIGAAEAQPYGGYPPTPTSYPPYTNSAVTVVYPAPAPVSVPPPVIVRPRQIAYLIAFKDSVIGLADAYWVSGNTLNYVTPDHRMRTAPLAAVDRTVSERLNREQNVSFSLPSQPEEAAAAVPRARVKPKSGSSRLRLMGRVSSLGISVRTGREK